MIDHQKYFDRLISKLHWEQNKIYESMRWIGSLEYSTDQGRFILTKKKVQELIEILGKNYPYP